MYSMRLLFCFLSISAIFSCSQLFINEQTSEITSIESTCVVFDGLIKDYSPDSIKNIDFLQNVTELKKWYLPPRFILYFKEDPEELIGIDYYEVRCVYNKGISNNVLGGLDSQLTDLEKVRIFTRVQTTLMKYQCEKGKLNSLEAIKNIGKMINWSNPENRKEFAK